MSESLGDGGGKSPCFEVDLYERTSSPLTPFVLITAKCRRPRFMYVIDGWLAGRDGPGGPGRAGSGRAASGRAGSNRNLAGDVGIQYRATSALLAADSAESVLAVASTSRCQCWNIHFDEK